MANDEEPHLVTSDNMGDPVTYWRQFRTSSDGNVIIGTGATKEQAREDAEKTYQAREEYLRLPEYKRLEILIAKDELYQKDSTEAIKILGHIVLSHLRWFRSTAPPSKPKVSTPVITRDPLLTSPEFLAGLIVKRFSQKLKDEGLITTELEGIGWLHDIIIEELNQIPAAKIHIDEER